MDNERSTIFSPDRKYRYTLWREWDFHYAQNGYAMFIGLNPSTADEFRNDPTVRKCIGFSKRWGYNVLCMMNLFAYRATNPRDMKACQTPIGDDNNAWLIHCVRGASIVVAAWGTHGGFLERDKEVLRLLDNLVCLRLTKGGFPCHPLYVPYDVKPIGYHCGKKEPEEGDSDQDGS